jgi:hypothetical protein
VTLELSIPGRREPIRLDARVARLFMVPAQLLTVAQGGIGLRITNAPESYFELLQRIQFEREGVGREAAAGARERGAPAAPLRRYRVRMTQLGRAHATLSASPEEAATLANAEPAGLEGPRVVRGRASPGNDQPGPGVPLRCADAAKRRARRDVE